MAAEAEPNGIVTRAIDAVASDEHLTADHAQAVLTELMEGRASDVQTSAFLIALRTKGETVSELVGLARSMRSLAVPVCPKRKDLIDTCGTGGGPSTFNVSTATGLVLAGAGCGVAKHGNRSNTSSCGSADLLEALGVEVNLPPDSVARCIDEVGFGFMFAPRHHTAMANVIGVRRALGVRTVFNFLGPLTNPAGARYQVLGVADRQFQEPVAEALLGLGSERAYVVSADDGMDEFSLLAPTRVIEVSDGRTAEWILDPTAHGIAADGQARQQVATALEGGDPEANAVLVRGVLAGRSGPPRDLVCLNTAAALTVCGKADDIDSGLAMAAEILDNGAALDVLDRLARFTRQEAGREGA